MVKKWDFSDFLSKRESTKTVFYDVLCQTGEDFYFREFSHQETYWDTYHRWNNPVPSFKNLVGAIKDVKDNAGIKYNKRLFEWKTEIFVCIIDKKKKQNNEIHSPGSAPA